MKSAMKAMVANETAKMAKEALDVVFGKTFHNVRKGVQSLLYNIVEHVMLSLLRLNFIKETLGTQIAKLSKTDEASCG